jgi:hypothetical protein
VVVCIAFSLVCIMVSLGSRILPPSLGLYYCLPHLSNFQGQPSLQPWHDVEGRGGNCSGFLNDVLEEFGLGVKVCRGGDCPILGLLGLGFH